MTKKEFEDLYGNGDWHLSDYDYRQIEEFYYSRPDLIDKYDFCAYLNDYADRFFGRRALEINPVTVIHELKNRLAHK